MTTDKNDLEMVLKWTLLEGFSSGKPAASGLCPYFRSCTWHPSMSTTGAQPPVTSGCQIDVLRGGITGVKVAFGRVEIRSLKCRRVHRPQQLAFNRKSRR